MSPVRVAWKFARYRVRPIVLLLAIAAIFAAVISSTAVMNASVSAAVVDSVEAEQAGYPFAVQVVNEAAGLDAVAATPGLVGVRDDVGQAETANGLLPIRLRVSGDPSAELGVLVQGRRPVDAEEVTVSRSVQEGLRLSVGSTVGVAAGAEPTVDRTVVGITEDPANRNDTTVVLVSSSLAPGDASTWLSSVDPVQQPGLVPLFEDRSLTLRTTELLAAERAAQVRAQLLPGAEYLPYAAAALMATVLATVLLLMRTVALRDHRSLVAAGMATSRAWKCLLGVAVAVILLGQLLGSTAGVLALALFRGPVSGIVEQSWTAIAVPWNAVVLAPMATIGVVVVVVLGSRVLASTRPAPAGSRLSVTGERVVLGGVTLGMLVFVTGGLQLVPSSLATPAGLLVAAGAPWLLLRLVTQGLRPATTILVATLARRFVVLVAVCSVLAWSAGYYAARETHNAVALAPLSQPLQPAGSLLVYEIPDTAARVLLAEYDRLGGQARAVYALPDESSTQLRATSPSLVACLTDAGLIDPNELPQSCFPDDTASSINGVLLSTTGDVDAAPRADPGLLRNGTVGLLQFGTGQGAAPLQIDTTKAGPDSTLGGNMPGLLLSPTDPITERLGLRPSEGRLVALLGFSELPPEDQATLRATITRVSPAAQVSESGDDYGYGTARSVADAAAVAGAGLVVLVLGVGGFSVVAAERRTRRVLADIGAGPGERRRIALRWALIPFGSLIIAAAAARYGAWLAAVDLPGGYGWLWWTPFVAGGLVSLVLLRTFLHVPPRVGE